jgi:hypothetical protein
MSNVVLMEAVFIPPCARRGVQYFNYSPTIPSLGELYEFEKRGRVQTAVEKITKPEKTVPLQGLENRTMQCDAAYLVSNRSKQYTVNSEST